VVAGVEISVESDHPPQPGGAMQVHMLGPLRIVRDGVALVLPTSRKVRALFAYLALSPRAVTRSQLCELLWDLPSDPRGELRWCLSKIRSIADEPARRRVHSHEDAIRLDLSDCFVDATEIIRASETGIKSLDLQRSRALATLFNGDFLEGLGIERSPFFTGWLTAQRRRFRGCHTALLEHLVGSVSDDEALGYLEKWVELAPFDRRVHEILLSTLGGRGRIAEGEAHLASTIRLFEAEGLDGGPIREAWRSARAKHAEPSRDRSATWTSTTGPRSGEPLLVPSSPRRASVAVMPFVDRSAPTAIRPRTAHALVHDIITRLAKLRCLFVIAEGTVFALHERHIGPEEAGRMLNVDYIVSGSIHCQAKRLGVDVELAETRTARIVWTELFNASLDDTFAVLEEIGDRIVASIASEIETIERNRAILKPPNCLDAWEAHHRGLWHMYRFNKPDNEQARHFFETAVRLDPTFARAYAGLSFTHFQDAFQGWTTRGPSMDQAFEAAGQSLMADDRDPAAHWALGRALWLRGNHDQSVIELEQAIDLSPNFALGHYTLAFVHSQAGDPGAAITSSDHSRQLSPFDPLLFGMLGSRAMALVRLQRFDEAADWAVKAAARPNAHPHIIAIATYSLALAGALDQAQAYAARLRTAIPRYSLADFFHAFHFDPAGQVLFREGAKRVGMA